MVDLILISAFCGVFYAGFKLGNKFKTLKEVASHVLEKLN